MTPEPSEEQARNRFAIINLVRIGGTAITLLGIAIWQSGLLRPGGSAEVGLPLALLGLIVSFGLSRVLIRRWRTPPER